MDLTANPTRAQMAEARALITDPDRAGRRPGARGIAWALLKAARGQSCRFDRLPEVRHHTAAPLSLAARLALTSEARRARIRARAEDLGFGPSNGGDAA